MRRPLQNTVQHQIVAVAGVGREQPGVFAKGRLVVRCTGRLLDGSFAV